MLECPFSTRLLQACMNSIRRISRSAAHPVPYSNPRSSDHRTSSIKHSPHSKDGLGFPAPDEYQDIKHMAVFITADIHRLTCELNFGVLTVRPPVTPPPDSFLEEYVTYCRAFYRDHIHSSLPVIRTNEPTLVRTIGPLTISCTSRIFIDTTLSKPRNPSALFSRALRKLRPENSDLIIRGYSQDSKSIDVSFRIERSSHKEIGTDVIDGIISKYIVSFWSRPYADIMPFLGGGGFDDPDVYPNIERIHVELAEPHLVAAM